MPDAITKTFDIRVTGSLPGETALGKLLDFASTTRATMDPEIRKRWDAILVEQAEDVQRVWRKLWVDWGLLEPKP